MKSFKNLSDPINADPERWAWVEKIGREYEAVMVLGQFDRAAHEVVARLNKYANERMRCQYDGKPDPEDLWYELMVFLDAYVQLKEETEGGE